MRRATCCVLLLAMLNGCAYWAAVPGPIDQANLLQAEAQRVRVWRLDSTRVELRDPTLDSLRLEGVTTDIRGQVLRIPRDSILRVELLRTNKGASAMAVIGVVGIAFVAFGSMLPSVFEGLTSSLGSCGAGGCR